MSNRETNHYKREDLDLDIDNYSLDDILALFKVDYNLTESQMKSAKMITLKMHPDKSGLDKKYFLFFSKAYKLLYQVYVFQDKSREKTNNVDYNNYKIDLEKGNIKILDKLFDKKDTAKFNEWFNKEFEKIRIQDDYTSNGYGDWLNSNQDICDDDTKCGSMDKMHREILKKKDNMKALISTKDIHEYNNNNYCDLINTKPDSYSSDVFSKFQFNDLKNAHVESVIPVTEKDYRQKYNNLEELKMERNNKIKPLTQEESILKIAKKTDSENQQNSQRAFKLLQQQQQVENKSNEWWSKLKQLT